jgi:hypothetical protein
MKELANKIANIVFLIGSLLLFIIVIVAFTKINSSEYSYMTTVGQNWNKGPIVKVDASGSPCSEEFKRIIDNNWPGTKEGCYCDPNLDLFYGPLREGHCRNKRDSYIFCKTISAKVPMMWEKWRGMSLCANRVAASYLDLTISSSDKGCPLNMRSCGKIDSLNNYLCVPQNTACPINKIFIGNKQSDMNYTSIQTSQDTYISFSNEDKNGNILNELFISDLQPCADPGYANYQGTPYLLDPFYYKHNCNDGVGEIKYDERYKLVDQYSYMSQIKDNNVLPFIATLPNYNIANDQHLTGLYSRSYIGVSPGCLDQIRAEGTAKNILIDLLDIQKSANSAYGVSVGALIMVICLLLFAIFYGATLFCADDQKVLGMVIIAPFIFIIVLLILCSCMASFTKSYGSNHNFFLDQNCVDTLTYNAAQSFYPNMNSAKGLSLFSALLSALLLVVSAYIMISNCCS